MSTALKTITELAQRVVRDDPEICAAHLAAELVRATVGVGRYALPVRRPAPPAPPPAKAAGGGRKKSAPKQGRLL